MAENINTFVAGEELTDYEGYAVKLDSDGTVIKVTAATDIPIGVVNSGDGDGENVAIAMDGTHQAAKLGGKDNPKSPYWDAVADLLMDWQFLEAKAEADPDFREQESVEPAATAEGES